MPNNTASPILASALPDHGFRPVTGPGGLSNRSHLPNRRAATYKRSNPAVAAGIDHTSRARTIIESSLQYSHDLCHKRGRVMAIFKLTSAPVLIFVGHGTSQIFRGQRFTDEYVPHNLPISHD
jgi:hypothetical protein